MKLVRSILCGAALMATAAVYVGCQVDSADEFLRNVTVNFTGFYTNPNASNIVSHNSGQAISTLDLRQNGDRLEAVDNNGNIWRGTLGEVQNGISSFNLDGRTSSGIEATFSGTLSTPDTTGSTSTNGSSESSAVGTMQGTYIEPDLFATFFGTATIPGIIDTGGSGTNTGGLAISPSSTTLLVNDDDQQFTASGGDGTFVWSVANTNGVLNTTSGSTVIYTRRRSGSNTLTVSSGGNTAQAVITQP